jgi:hypothetical protein
MFYRKAAAHVESETDVQRRQLGVKLLRWLLILIFVLCAWKVYEGPTPWSRAIQDRIDKAAIEGILSNAAELKTLTGWIKSDVLHPGVLREKEHGVIGWWYAAAFGMGASFLLAISLPLWAPARRQEGDTAHDVHSADEENKGETGFARLVSGRPLFLLLMLLAVIVGGWMRAPRLDHSLWNDEEYAMRKFAHGDYKKDDRGQPIFQPVTWATTLTESSNGNNHVLHSILSRLSLSTWKTVWGHEGSEFSERWLRMPSFIAGLLSIAVIAWLGWEFGMAWAGLAAAWLLALHPWHIRFAVEARGFSLAIFFIGIALLGLIRAQRDDSLRGWLMFAVGQFGFLTSFAGAIYVAIALNAMAVIEMVLRRQPRRLLSLIAFNLLAAIPVLLLTAPSIPQLLGFVSNDSHVRLAADAEWLRDLGSHLAAGLLYSNPINSDHVGTSWETMRHALPFVFGPLGWFLGLIAALGLITALFESAATRFTIVGMTLAGALGFWHASVAEHPNLTWYYLYLLVPLCLAVGLAVVRFQVLPAVLTLVVVGLYGYATERPRENFIQQDRQPIRQTVDAIRTLRPHALTGVFGVSDRQARSYDPGVEVLESVEQLEALVALAQRGNQSLFVYYAGDRESKMRAPEVYQRLKQGGDFVPFKQFKATEAMFSYFIYRYEGSGL